MTALTASAALLSPLVGAVADVWGARAVAIAVAALGGLAKASTDPAPNRLIMLHIEPRRRGLLMGFKQSGVNLGGVVAAFTLPIGAEAFGWRPTMAFVERVNPKKIDGSHGSIRASGSSTVSTKASGRMAPAANIEMALSISCDRPAFMAFSLWVHGGDLAESC